MPKLVGVRERRHQPFYDTLIRADTTTAPSPTVQSTTSLFNGTNIGLEYWTNMNIAGVFSSDETYIILAIRCWLHFTGNNALLQYQLATSQMYLALNVGDKPQFSGPCWLFPAGGGIHGYDSTTPAMTNGVPSTEAILKLAKPIPLPARQSFKMTVNLHDMGNTSLRTSYLNASTTIGIREIKVFVDGLHTRDVL